MGEFEGGGDEGFAAAAGGEGEGWEEVVWMGGLMKWVGLGVRIIRSRYWGVGYGQRHVRDTLCLYRWAWLGYVHFVFKGWLADGVGLWFW